MRKLSVIVPCRDQESVICETHRRLRAVFGQAGYPVELVFVDDGSRDRTLCKLKALAGADRSVRIVRFSRSFGRQAAVAAGLRYCTGTEAALIDADLQDPPEEIPRMLELMDREQCNVVHGQRAGRDGDGFFGKLASRCSDRLLNLFSDVKLPRGAGDFRLMDRKVIDVLNALPERNRYLRGLIGWIGFNQVNYTYPGGARLAGTTERSMAGSPRLASDGLFPFSRRPLRLAVRLGLLSVLVALGLAAWAVVRKLAFAGETIPGWTSTVLIVLFLGGVQLLSTGLLGEYIGSIFDESKRRPEYVVAELVNLEEKGWRASSAG